MRKHGRSEAFGGAAREPLTTSLGGKSSFLGTTAVARLGGLAGAARVPKFLAKPT